MTRILDAPRDPAPVSPDLVLDRRGDRCDFALAGPNAGANAMGLRAGQTLATAIMLCLMSDGRGTPDIKDPPGNLDLRGWPGDGFDVDTVRGEAPLGSTLWDLRRKRSVDARTADEVARAAEVSLQPLVRQGLLGRAAFEATPDPASNRIGLLIRLEAPNGRVIFDGPFAGLWEALLAAPDPLAP